MVVCYHFIVENILVGLDNCLFYSSSLMALFVITGYMLYFDRWKKKKSKNFKKKNKLFYLLDILKKGLEKSSKPFYV